MTGSTIEVYRLMTAKKITFIVVCCVLALILFLYAATLGAYPIAALDVFRYIGCAFTGSTPGDLTAYHIVIDLRMPRITGAIVCGFALAICGAAMQSMLKNPLADPYTMGISSGAGLGAAIAIILGFELVSGGGIIINAFVFAVIPALVILFISRFRKATPTMMVLCGIALMYLFNAMTQLFMLIAEPDAMATVYQWMIGSLEGLKYDQLALVLIITVAGGLYIQYMANQLNVMGLGDESAKTLGVNVDRKRMEILLCITLVAASVVSITGIIGFVGLVSPHIVRTVIGADNRFLIPASGILGAVLLLAADVVARLISMFISDNFVLPVGVITACIGGPLFLYLVIRGHKEVWS